VYVQSLPGVAIDASHASSIDTAVVWATSFNSTSVDHELLLKLGLLPSLRTAFTIDSTNSYRRPAVGAKLATLPWSLEFVKAAVQTGRVTKAEVLQIIAQKSAYACATDIDARVRGAVLTVDQVYALFEAVADNGVDGSKIEVELGIRDHETAIGRFVEVLYTLQVVYWCCIIEL
jgi:hypothetical protein